MEHEGDGIEYLKMIEDRMVRYRDNYTNLKGIVDAAVEELSEISEHEIDSDFTKQRVDRVVDSLTNEMSNETF